MQIILNVQTYYTYHAAVLEVRRNVLTAFIYNLATYILYYNSYIDIYYI